MGLTDVKKELKKLDKDKLIDLIADLYKKNKSVKEFFDFYVNPNERELFEKYRDKIFEAFYPKRGNIYKLKDGKQAISDFKKMGSSADLLADLMLFYVETGVRFTNNYGDINEPFYKSLATTFYESLTLMENENLLEKFEERVDKVVDDTRGIGWGFHDYLVEVWISFYPAEEEENETEEK
ncbi:DUF6155 family protein [Flavobacterium sp. CHNK8]|uniref:DUF6155 family protein n=1 Tax=unclassified Flavobacterium TaxID=196869 RepID=UPI001C8D6EE1|nr:MULTISPECIES: DUF6155 family protein [unclassified Flavobacterium]QZK89818.1 DUF6155 family protein [Flavobacterium sp. CHNK8]CAH0335167.1 hypothetical protein FVB9288_00798 [Flavobacterium sp. CECT 9288]